MKKLYVTLAVVLGATLVHPGGARALPYTFTLYDGSLEPMSALDQLTYLNRARCVCDRQTTPTSGSLWVGVSDPGSLTSDAVHLYLGPSCDDPLQQPDCWEAGVLNHADFSAEQLVMLPINRVVDPVGGECLEVDGVATLHVLQGDPTAPLTASYDLEVHTVAPPAPFATTVTARSDLLEAGVMVRWEPPATGAESIQRYNVLCEVRAEPAGMSDMDLADWQDSIYVCGRELDPEGTPHPIMCTSSLAEGAWPRRCYVCASVDASTTEVLLTGLPADRVVRFAVVSVDGAGNVSRQSNVDQFDTELMQDPDDPIEYDCACRGGAQGGGSIPLGLLLLIGLGLIWRRARRRK